MKHNKITSYLALTRLYNLSKTEIINFLQVHKIEELFTFNAKYLETKFNIKKNFVNKLKQIPQSEIAKDLEWINAENNSFICYEDINYPQSLKQIHNPPIALYTTGSINLLQKKQIAIVGTRKPCFYSKQQTKYFASHLARSNLTITSGLALGIDAIAHDASLEINGFTIAVLGSGLNKIRPLTNTRLAQRIARNGLLVSEFPLNLDALAWHFPMRNRIISALSDAVLIVEAGIKSGTLITARHAIDQNKDVFVLPGNIDNINFKGSHLLIKEGASLVDEPQDISLEVVTEDITVDFTNLTSTEQKILNFIKTEPTLIDEISLKLNLNIAQLSSYLLDFEIRGLISNSPFGYIRNIEIQTDHNI